MTHRYASYDNTPFFWEHPEIDWQLKVELESLLHTGRRVRIFYGNVDTGEDWNEEYSTFGYIGRSMGTEKIPLLIANTRSYGGPAILTNCIVKITFASGGHVIWEHPKYFCNPLTIRPTTGLDAKYGYAEEVIRKDQVVARFSKPGKAAMWVDFMEGRRNNKG